MESKDLPLAGSLLNPDKGYLARVPQIASLAGREVLCIGYSEAEIDEYVAPLKPKSISALTLWEGHTDSQVSKYPLVIGDITKKTNFAANSFDAIVTLSVFEHLQPLPGAVKEMHRLLRPKGHLYIFFGPAWSCAAGHHIYERPGDRLLDFCRGELPAHIHLLCSREEIIDFYEKEGYSHRDALAALHWFYDADHINRLMFDDYAVVLGKYFQILYQEAIYTDLPLSHIELLRSRFPGYQDFSTYGGKYVYQVLK